MGSPGVLTPGLRHGLRDGRMMHHSYLKGYKHILDIMEKVLMVICALLFAGVVTLSAIEIFTRYFLNYSSTISGELGLILMTWIYFLGFTILFKRGEDVVMEYFFRRLPNGIRRFVEWLTHLAILIFLSTLVWNSIKFYRMTSTMEHPFLPIKYSYTVQPILVGSFLALVVAVYFLWEKTDAVIRERLSIERRSIPQDRNGF
jgi:TRAP-type C4-dicarboxylate transport system permease small subunit